MAVTINGTTGITTPDLTSNADISVNSVPFGAGGGNVATNVAAGDGALNANTTATKNVGIGYRAGYNNTTGQFNVLIGNEAGYRAAGTGSIGDASVFIGYQTGYSCQANNNIGIGNGALYANTTGTFNIGIGVGAGNAITTGQKNTIVGANSGNSYFDVRTSNNNIMVSDGNGVPKFAGVNKIVYLLNPGVSDSSYTIVTNNTKGGTVNILSKAQLFPVQSYYGSVALILLECGSSEGTAGAYNRTDVICVIERFGSYTCSVLSTGSNDGIGITNWTYAYDGSNFKVTQNWSSGGTSMGTTWGIVNITGSTAS